jgi:hypothetical protein
MDTRRSIFFATPEAVTTMEKESISEHAHRPDIGARLWQGLQKDASKKRIAEGAYNALSQTLSMQGTYHYVMM